MTHNIHFAHLKNWAQKRTDILRQKIYDAVAGSCLIGSWNFKKQWVTSSSKQTSHSRMCQTQMWIIQKMPLRWHGDWKLRVWSYEALWGNWNLSYNLLVNKMILWLIASVSLTHTRTHTCVYLKFTDLYLNSSAGIDVLLMKAVPLLAMLVLRKMKEKAICYPSVDRK